MSKPQRAVDHIVVGSGAAGSIVAARLVSQGGASVLVIEAGPELRPAGTGTGSRIVDPELRGRGVDGLRVTDSSIVPTPVTGHSAAVSMRIGEKGASMMIARGAAP